MIALYKAKRQAGNYVPGMAPYFFADILTWEKGRYIRIVKYKDGVFDTKFFEIADYEAAVKKWGQLQFDECFGYTPLLGLGGSRNADHLRKVNIKEHIELITQSVGKVGA